MGRLQALHDDVGRQTSREKSLQSRYAQLSYFLLFHSLTVTGHVSHVCGKLKLVSLSSLNTTEIYAPTLMLGMLKPGLKVMLYSLPANTFMNLPLRSALGTSKFSFTSVWTGDELARGPAPNSASPVMSSDSFLLLEPHFRSLLTL